MLSDFVNDGGGLIVLGGYWAFQRGGYAGTPLAEMLPVRWTEKDDLRAHPGGALLAAATQATWKLEAKFASAPRAFYLHDFAAKENTTVQLIAGQQPAVVTGNFGRGRVVACGLTIDRKSTRLNSSH